MHEFMRVDTKKDDLFACNSFCMCLQCHRAGVVHGDIKSNNVLVTSWNWLVLADFTGLKPAYLPEDNPADLSFFFDVRFQSILQSMAVRFILLACSQSMHSFLTSGLMCVTG
jgi:serine/threonine protein kinase